MMNKNSGQLYEVTNVIDTYVYRALLQSGNIGMASAAGFYQSYVLFFHLYCCSCLLLPRKPRKKGSDKHNIHCTHKKTGNLGAVKG